MKQTIWNIRIPTIAALLILLAGIAATSYLVQNRIITLGFASPDTIPENIAITNINNTSFTVSFATKAPTKAYIEYGQSQNLGSIAYDSRDSNGSQQEYYSHSITIEGLKENSNYVFQIIINDRTILNNNKLFQVKTAPSIAIPPKDQKPILGKALLPDGSSASDALVFLKVEGMQSLSTITKDSGEYLLPTSLARTIDLKDFFFFKDNTPITIQIVRGGLSTEIKTLFTKASEVPIVTLAKNYDFTKDSPIINAVQIDQATNLLKIPPPPGLVEGSITIINPQKNETFIDQQPLFQGSAVPNEKVKIIIESDPSISEVIADTNGTWRFRPTKSLTPGEHTITIETKDQFGIIKRIKQSFTVFAQGSQITESATPSATPTLIFTPPPTSLTPAITIITTPSPTPKPSLTSTQAASLTPTSTRAATPSQQPGEISSTFVLTFTSAFLIIAGIALLAF